MEKYNYRVTLYKGNWFDREGGEVKIDVMANTHEHALALARRRGYKLKDGWKWDTIWPL